MFGGACLAAGVARGSEAEAGAEAECSRAVRVRMFDRRYGVRLWQRGRDGVTRREGGREDPVVGTSFRRGAGIKAARCSSRVSGSSATWVDPSRHGRLNS